MIDLSKHGIEQKKTEINSIGSKAEKKLNFAIFRVILVAIIVVMVMGVAAVFGSIQAIIDGAPKIEADDVLPSRYKSYVYDSEGNLIQEVIGEQSNRIYVTIDEMNDTLIWAFIDLEDERFYEHNGIDIQSIIRAAVATIQGESQGASTITQQLLKLNIFEGGEEETLLLKFKRKFREQYLAMQLEKEMSKDEILDAYLNTINMGRGNYGVEAAANYYFNKSVDSLVPVECAILAAIAQSPTNLNPVDNPERNRSRRDICLDYMLKQGHISQEEHDSAVNDLAIYDTIAANAQNNENMITINSYYTEEAIRQLINDLVNKHGYTREDAVKLVYSGGVNITLAQDPVMQEIVDRHYSDNANFTSTEYYPNWALSYKEEDGSISQYSTTTPGQIRDWYGRELLFASEDACYSIVEQYKQYMGFKPENIIAEYCYPVPQVQSSFVIIDQHTGYVKALSGGRGRKYTNWSLNRATQMPRQPGSVFKIVSVYSPAIEERGITLATTRKDEIYKSPTGHQIRNVDNSYEGNVSVRRAIIVSKNTIASKILNEDVTTELSLSYLLDRYHFSTIDPTLDNVEALGIGGITYGVTCLDTTAAFAAIANGGIYNEPLFYTKVTDRDGNVIIDNTVAESSRAIRESTAYILTSAMQDVVYASGGTAYSTAMGLNIDQAGKTGTTDDYKELWFVGYTPYYTAGIWFAYDNYISMNYHIRDHYGQQRLWRSIMREVHADLGEAHFEMPDTVERRSLCSISGKIPSSKCPTTTELYPLDGPHSGEVCDDHFTALVCTECGDLATEHTPPAWKTYRIFAKKTDVPTVYCTHVETDDPDYVPEDEEGEEGEEGEEAENGEGTE